MRLSSAFWTLLSVCLALTPPSSASSFHLRQRDYDAKSYYALHLSPSAKPQDIASLLGLQHEGTIGELEDHHLFSREAHAGDIVKDELTTRRRRRKRDSLSESDLLVDGVLWHEKQKTHQWVKRAPLPKKHRQSRPPPVQGEDVLVKKQQNVIKQLEINDPEFPAQWHLLNIHEKGHDINVTDVWMTGVTGKNSTVAIVDDGLDMDSIDLKANYFAEGSYDFNDHNPVPKPKLSDDRHGTRCAGEIAAVRNSACGVGVAYDSRVAGIRILSKQITDADEAVAMNYAYQDNQIYSCSWGPPDDGQSMDAPGVLIRRAMVNGVQKGRGGKGSLYVFASGNGAANGDNCNFDGYTNSIYSITIGAVDRKGQHPYYSERCCAQMVVTYSSGSGDFIHTTDVGENACYGQHGGTSAAAPIAAGIFALVLEVRPDLTWRDMQYLALQTAVQIDPEGGEWEDAPGSGRKFSHKFGYGKLDAYAIVEAARDFKSVKPQAWWNSKVVNVNKAIPEGADSGGVSSTIPVTKAQLDKANVARLEHVTVTINIQHTRRGDIAVDLYSPLGVISRLSVARRFDQARAGYKSWTFMSVKHWGESGVGDWKIVVRDEDSPENSGTFTDWQLTLWGESIDASKATLLPLPGIKEPGQGDDDESEPEPVPTVTVIKPPPHPSGHATRPVNEKPSVTGAPMPVGSTTIVITHDPATTTAMATIVPTPSGSGNSTTDAQEDSLTGWPSFLPTLGFKSKSTLVWVYGSAVIIVAFIVGLSIFLLAQRRKRLRNQASASGALDGYEFEHLVETDDEEGEYRDRENGNGVPNGATGGRKKKGKRETRGRELYDAFAGVEDASEGEDVSSLVSDSEDGHDDSDADEKTAMKKEEDRQKLLKGDS